ncbi:MAG: ATP synthase F1 subunit gamma [Candidatus Dormibacteraceae bacterium]
MASLRDLRRRIRSNQNTQKITKAMQVVSASRLRRAQRQVEAARPYSEKMVEVLATTAERAKEFKHPFLERREGRRAVIILITSDRGLAGALNVSTIRASMREVNQRFPDHPRFVTLGRKGRDYLIRFRREVIADASDLSAPPQLAQVLPAVTVALDEYREGKVDAVMLAYARWVSTLRQEAVVRTMVPVEVPEREDQGTRSDYIYEPEPEEVMGALLPRYVETQVFQAVLENKASEHAARMVAMQNATSAAGDLIKDLTLTANKVRQATITAELMEIVGGAEALRESAL